MTDPGWHPDPFDSPPSGRLRYWDGENWTAHLADPQPPAPTPAAQPAPWPHAPTPAVPARPVPAPAASPTALRNSARPARTIPRSIVGVAAVLAVVLLVVVISAVTDDSPPPPASGSPRDVMAALTAQGDRCPRPDVTKEPSEIQGELENFLTPVLEHFEDQGGGMHAISVWDAVNRRVSALPPNGSYAWTQCGWSYVLSSDTTTEMVVLGPRSVDLREGFQDLDIPVAGLLTNS